MMKTKYFHFLLTASLYALSGLVFNETIRASDEDTQNDENPFIDEKNFPKEMKCTLERHYDTEKLLKNEIKNGETQYHHFQTVRGSYFSLNSALTLYAGGKTLADACTMKNIDKVDFPPNNEADIIRIFPVIKNTKKEPTDREKKLDKDAFTKIEQFIDKNPGKIIIVSLSDLHGCISRYAGIEKAVQHVVDYGREKDCDIQLVMAGDFAERASFDFFTSKTDAQFGSKCGIDFLKGLEQITRKPIIYVFGNHDMQDDEAWNRFCSQISKTKTILLSNLKNPNRDDEPFSGKYNLIGTP